MSFKNIFGSGGNEAKSAEESARKVSEKIPGARPEQEGVDPELYDDIPEAARDPKIVRETSPEALSIMNNFLAPLFKSTQAVADKQRETSENPESTSDMASSVKDEASKKVKVEIREEDQPKNSDERLDKLQKDNREAVKNARRPDEGSAEG
ncbi:hypothetical protein ACFU99_17305 [Streptomyces sp. NPDC057654]|uniref:hypothetical protein n=1 Tax=Streptomyces sp. NPDC057654 TaxID=3346196 RepID=UPI00369A8E0C